MSEKEIIEQRFKDKLRLLCEEYKAEITIANIGRAYSSVPIIEVNIESILKDGEIIQEFQSFNLGDYFSY